MDQREILQRVAAGDLTPAEAARLLEQPAGTEPAEPPAEAGDAATEPGEAATEPLSPEAAVRAVRLRGAFRAITVVADPTVRSASVDGAHSARVDGTTLVIEGEEEALEGFRFESRRGRFQIESGRRARARKTVHIGVDNPRPEPLVVRINPDLSLDAEVAAGALKIHGMRSSVTAQVAAGALVVEDSGGPLDLTTAAGPIKVRGRITEGEHRIKCEAGAVKVVLERGSDVHIRARASLGKASLPGTRGPAGFAIGNTATETTIGNGRASLTIDCSVGGIKVVLADEED